MQDMDRDGGRYLSYRQGLTEGRRQHTHGVRPVADALISISVEFQRSLAERVADERLSSCVRRRPLRR